MAQKVKKTSRVRRERGKTTVSSKNQITVPVEAMRQAGIAPGTKLSIYSIEPGKVVLVDDSPDKRAERIENRTEGYRYPPGYLKELRKDWDGRP